MLIRRRDLSLAFVKTMLRSLATSFFLEKILPICLPTYLAFFFTHASNRGRDFHKNGLHGRWEGVAGKKRFRLNIYTRKERNLRGLFWRKRLS